MRVITLNLNGIRSAANKKFFEWALTQNVDFICVQETKAQMEHLKNDALFLPDYYHYFHDANRPGYSGVGIYTRLEPDHIIKKLGWPAADEEGRYIQADFGKLSIVSLYMPSGSSGPGRQIIKFDFMDRYMEILKKNIKSNRHFIICGDWNIVHKEIDIKNFRGNQKNSGCLPEERAWIDQVFTKVGFVDGFRVLNQEAEQYTWWSNRGRAYEKNVGWRIDYQVITDSLRNLVKKVEIYKGQRFSDHAPLIIDYDYKL